MTTYLLAVDRYVDVNGSALRPAGFVTRDLAHWHGVPHTTVLVVPIRCLGDGKFEILIHRRPANKKVSPDTWDTFGGHVDVRIQDGKLVPPADNLDDRDVFRNLIDATAIREANEEIRIAGFQFAEKEIHRFGGYGDFEFGVNVPGSDNVEFSTMYVALLPPDASTVTATDTVSRGGVEVEVANLKLTSKSLDDLLTEYRRARSEFADGLGRILEKLAASPGTQQSFSKFVQRQCEALPNG